MNNAVINLLVKKLLMNWSVFSVFSTTTFLLFPFPYQHYYALGKENEIISSVEDQQEDKKEKKKEEVKNPKRLEDNVENGLYIQRLFDSHIRNKFL